MNMLVVGGGGLGGTVWFGLPACYHQNLVIFWTVWLFQIFLENTFFVVVEILTITL